MAEKEEYSPMMQKYLETKEKYKDCILFYRLGDFYEMFFEDAIIASRELEITLTGKVCGTEERAPMAGVPHHAAENYAARLIEKGYKGGGGNSVKIRHNSTYTTAYLHLSKYGKDIAVGKRVNQGQVIGYVGSTGASTGPHLDFRVWKGGSPIDPLKMVSPPVEPIPATLRPTFDSVVVALRGEL